MNTPILLFTYKRVQETKLTIEALFKANNISNYDLYVFSDGPRSDKDKFDVYKIRGYLNNVDFPSNSLSIYANEYNKGLASSIISGVSEVFEKYESVIVLEDDLLVSKNFLAFMNQALRFYQNDKKVFSISGYTPELGALNNYHEDFYFCPRGSSWGWATWKDRWETVDWEVKSYSQFKYNLLAQWNFAKGGIDLPGMLRDQMRGRINSWAIRWVYQQFLNEQYTVYPSTSKVKSIGFDNTATHTTKERRFKTELHHEDQKNFEFHKFSCLDPKIMKDFRKVFSIWNRFKDRF